MRLVLHTAAYGLVSLLVEANPMSPRQ